MIHAWRIVKEKYADSAFSGEGARLGGGRFNSIGIPVVYTAESLALAELEILVNLPSDRLLGSYVAFRVSFDEGLVMSLQKDKLPTDWRSDPAPTAVCALGDEWVRGGESLVLDVPSAVVPAEHNYLIDPHHAAMSQLEIRGPLDPDIDPRLS